MALFIASNDLFTYNKNAHGVGIMKENKYQWLFISHWSRDHLVIWVTVTMPYSSYYEYLLVLHVPVPPALVVNYGRPLNPKLLGKTLYPNF